jgi:hypothetical protein
MVVSRLRKDDAENLADDKQERDDENRRNHGRFEGFRQRVASENQAENHD